MGTEATVASVAKNAIARKASDSLDIHHRRTMSTENAGDRRLALGGEAVVGRTADPRTAADGGARRRRCGPEVGGQVGRCSGTFSPSELEQSAQHSNAVRGDSASCSSSICQEYVVHSC